MGDRPTKDLWGVGAADLAAPGRLGSTTVRELAADADERADRRSSARRPGRTIGRLGRGVSSSTVDDTPWVARAHGRETTYQQDLETRDEVADAVHVARRAGRRRHPGRGPRRACGCTSRCASRRSSPSTGPQARRADLRRRGDRRRRRSTSTAVLEDDRAVRLLGVRAEMVPPEGGYEPPRTHGRRGGCPDRPRSAPHVRGYGCHVGDLTAITPHVRCNRRWRGAPGGRLRGDAEDSSGAALGVRHGVGDEGVVARFAGCELDEPALGGREVEHLAPATGVPIGSTPLRSR